MILIAVLVCLPNAALAYQTTEQSVHSLGDRYDMYVITFRLNFLNRAASVPMFATRNLENAASAHTLGYEIITANESVVETGNSVGIVLSDTTIEDGRYQLEKGEAGIFSLVVFHDKLNEPAVDRAMRVTSLPFILTDEDGKEAPAYLPKEELKKYITPIKGLAADTGISIKNIEMSLIKR